MVQIIPDEWHEVLPTIQKTGKKNFHIVVVGNKGVGKSTFIRFLTRKLIASGSRVCRLETDCGQPDITPPGLASLALFQDGFNTQVVSQRFLGYLTPSVDPTAYVGTLERVFEDYEAAHSENPLIVNMHGWHTGIGRKTYEAVVQMVNADFVINIDMNPFEIDTNNPFLHKQYAPASPEWIKLPPVVCLTDDEEGKHIAQMKPRDKRWVKFASHFRPDLVKRDEFRSSSPSAFFVSPYCRVLSLERGSIAVTFSHASVVPRDPIKAIEKLLVGLVNKASGQCVCLGYVASFDAVQVHIMIPPNIPKALTDTVDELVRGEMNWSPREQVCYKGKTTSTDFTDQPEGEAYFLTNALVDDNISRTASTRTNLVRKRLVH